MHINLIWLDTPQSLMEADWIRWLFQNFEVAEHVAPNLDLFKDKSIYILSSNSHPLARLPGSFLKGIEGLSGKGLFHLSDEWFSGGYEVYTAFDFVLRNYYSKIFDNAGIKTLPLGFTDNLANRPCFEVAADRKFLWSFAGAKTAARIEMFNNLKILKPHKCVLFDIRKRQKATLDRSAFMALLSDAVFSPCPMGNVVLESFRVYESLEMGCIPIVERRGWMPYFDCLMPGHPLPTFSSWRKARQFLEAVSKDKSTVTAYQQSIGKWWQSYKMEVRNEVTSFVSVGLEGGYRSSLRRWICRKGINHQVWRIVELLKHASHASLQERISLTTRRTIGRLWSPPRADSGRIHS